MSHIRAPNGAVGLGDLARALFARGVDEFADSSAVSTARVLGFERRKSQAKGKGPRDDSAAELRQPATPKVSEPPPPAAVDSFAGMPFWRPVAVEHRSEEREEGGPAEDEVLPLGVNEGQSKATSAPDPPDIVAWPRLWRVLDDGLRSPRPRREIDAQRLVRDWARGRVVRQLPRKEGLSHARVALAIDRSIRLEPFFADQRRVVARLVQRLGRARLRPVAIPGASKALPQLRQDEILLVLSDLGFYGDLSAAEAWQRWARQLRHRGQRPRALVPCPRNRWNKLAGRDWLAFDWQAPDRFEASALPPATALEELMQLLSVAVRVEPVLLRRLRWLLREADLGTEAEVWLDSRVATRSSVAIMLEPKAARVLRGGFAGLESDLKEAVARCLLDTHRHLPLEIRAEEAFNLLAAGISETTLGELLEQGVELIRRIAATLESEGDRSSNWGKSLESWAVRFQDRLSASATSHDRLREPLSRVHRVIQQRRADAGLSAGVTPEMFPPPAKPIRRYVVYQRAAGLEVDLADPQMSPKGINRSSLVEVRAAEPRLTVGDGVRAARKLSLESLPAKLELSLPRSMKLTTDVEAVTLEPWQPILDDVTSWACAAGRDEFGLWAAFEVEGVRQRVRWIPAGRFWMGSPESEEGRFDNEGPRHPVTLTEGFWLAEVPCTQALWTAVMGSNPSYREGEQLPVEGVDWNDCMRFVDRLNEKFRHLDARLPTEAEWEYACRAGTETATWRGDLKISEIGASMLLQDIAWYGLNSDNVTHEVGAKLPNPWGLYDTLGNVDEWCWDYAGKQYRGQADVDPEGALEGTSRVRRGGAWNDYAGVVRAAFRYQDPPVGRFSDLGFRLSLGRGPADRAVSPKPVSTDTGAARGGTTRRAGGRRSRAWIDRLGWASDGGLDHFGRWASFEVGGVETRLRWIVPGRFSMGSPPEEVGRWDDEGPVHEVTLTEGFWLGETPCTQDLWQRVMGSNPSRFQSARRPVENVSWDDVREFLDALRHKVPAIRPRLPSEAQWEYACRAGTTTATWLGDLEILGERNAPALDSIAWYGGNSGVGFELSEGFDSSDWSEKQYPHRLAGTREVALKGPNPWGFYDMLGNVWEWCNDFWMDHYPDKPQVDPTGPGEGPMRVIRGGSWDAHARYLRAVFRYCFRPVERDSALGFRLSLGRES